MQNEHESLHGECWDLIPWYVNGRIDDDERRRLNAHFARCADCREEVETQRHLHQSMQSAPGIEYLPSGPLRRLQIDIERIESLAPAPETRQVPPAAAPVTSRHLVSRQAVLAAGFAAMTAALLLVAGVLWTGRGHDPRADYYTVTEPTRRPSGEVIRAVFSSSMSVAELQGALDEAQLKIVGGPTEAGVYSLASTGGRPVAQSLLHLRAHAGVRFAEVAAPTSGNPP
jgi:anti-sigma factor RsiW